MAKLKTGRHTSAIRETRRALRRKKVNDVWRGKIKTSVKKFKKYIAEKKLDEAKKTLGEINSILDRAVKKKVIHRNKAANQKSRLSISLNKVSSKA